MLQTLQITINVSTVHIYPHIMFLDRTTEMSLILLSIIPNFVDGDKIIMAVFYEHK